MRLLVLTTLYPNAVMPNHGIFVENRLRAYQQKYDVDIKVVAPVPWFPFTHNRFKHWAKWANTAPYERRHDIEIWHPRYAIPPKIGMSYAPVALEKCFTKSCERFLDEGWDFDLIDAHYYYPDGVAAVKVANALQKPVCVTARGTDINLIPQFPRQRDMILDASHHADASICVADALRDEMIRLGAIPEKIHTLRNGVDLELFTPLDREKIRTQMNLSGSVIASIGHLIERKGHHLVIEALADIPNATLMIVGDGPQRPHLESLVATLSLTDRVRFTGALPHGQLPKIYNAADVLALASSREGWPNVLLEAMACGTPCIASPVWGTSEVITTPVSGSLTDNNSAKSFAHSLNQILANPPSRHETRAYAEKFSWSETADRMHTIFTNLITKKHKRLADPSLPAILTSHSQQPKAIVTIDTEEIFDWRHYGPQAYEVADPADIAKFQNICQAENIKPIYFLTQPILDDVATATYFQDLHKQKLADLGIHMHQWVTAPFQHTDTKDLYESPFYSFQYNLPDNLHKEKLHALAKLFEKKFGIPPDMHRAGRYGIAPENYQLLAAIGISLDFSPCAGFDFSHKGGPDFSTLGNHPFIMNATGDRPVTVIPVCGASVFKRTRIFKKHSDHAGFSETINHHNPPRKFIPQTVIRLSSEGTNIKDLLALTKHFVKEKTPILTFTIHSSSLTVGANSYGQTPKQVQELLETSQKFMQTFKEKFDGVFLNADELKAGFQPESTKQD